MPARSWRRDLELSRLHRQRVDDNPPRCAYCSKLIPAPRRYHPNIKYCKELCSKRAQKEKSADRQRAARAKAWDQESDEGILYPDDKIRRDEVYHEANLLLSYDEITLWLDRELADVAVAKKLGCTPQAAGRARRAIHNDRLLAEMAKNHVVPDEVMVLLGISDAEMRELLAQDSRAFEEKLVTLADAFVSWRDRFFPTYITKAVHRRWIIATLRTIYLGGRTLILSPPRHGKTELLIHFCVWLICRNPDIRILWIGPNGDIAENSLGAVRDILATHGDLKAAYLAPGESWEPSGRSKMWQTAKFKVGNRTIQQKQPTMWCAGVGGKILSLDADFIVVDDPADPDDSQTGSGRMKIETWFKIKLTTRKMRFTGLVLPSSRVHVEDLYAGFLESDLWTKVIDRAHDESICGLELWADHDDTTSCVLFPEMNPLDYLREQESEVGPALFDMMYQNQPRPDGTMIFDPDIIRAECLDRSRGLGLSSISAGYRLIAGLDPAARATQAAFCWAIDIDNDVDYMVDLEEQKGGGIEGAMRLMREWHDAYNLSVWVVEDNAYQKVFFDDPRVKELALELGLTIIPHTTGLQKHDPEFGVAKMALRFHAGKVNLPYAGTEAQRKVDALIRQLTNFTGDTGKSKKKTDILMAAWFPQPTMIRRWRRKARRDRARAVGPRSYPGYTKASEVDIPWGSTRYPGGR